VLYSTRADHPLAARQVEIVFMSSCYSRRDDIFTFFTFHVAPLGNGTYSEARRFADDSRWKRWIEHFFRSVVSSASFLCCFGGSVSPRISMHQFYLVRTVLFRLISCSRKSIIPRYTAFPFRCTSIICNNVFFYYARELRSAKLVSNMFISYNFREDVPSYSQ